MRRHLILLSVSLLLPQLAFGQEDEASVQRARELFGAGVQQHEGRRYQEAVDSFRAVLAIRASAAVRYNLALNLFELGQYPEADAQVQLILADSQAPPPIRDSAIELRQHMDERGGRLAVAAEGAPAGAELQVDDYPIEDPSRPVRVIHGTHQVSVVHEDEVLGSEVVRVAVGATEEVTVAADGSEPAGGAPPLFDGGSFEGAEPVSSDWRFWVALGVVAVVIVGVVIGTAIDDDDTGARSMPLIAWD